MIRKFKLTYRFMIVFVISVLMPTLVISTLVLNYFSYTSKTKVFEYANALVFEVAKGINNDLNEISDTIIEVSNSQVVQQALSYPYKNDEVSLINFEYSFEQDIINKYSFSDKLKRLSIYSPEFDLMLNHLNSNIIKPANFSLSESSFVDETASIGGIKWDLLKKEDSYLYEDRVVAYTAIFPTYGNELIGYMVSEFDSKYIETVYHNSGLIKNSHMLISDSTGKVVSSLNKEVFPIGRPIFEKEMFENIGTSQIVIDIDNASYTVIFSKILVSNWYVINLIPESYFTNETYTILIIIISVATLFIALSLIMSLIISHSILSPVKQLKQTMNKVHDGDLKIRVNNDLYKDEMSEIKSSFNYMLDKIEKLTKDIKIKERRKSDAELKMLQAQINPHFLSNTLNSIQWMAEIQGNYNIQIIVKKLIDLLQICSKTSDTFISIKQELQYIKAYSDLQQYRYLDKFELHVDIPDNLFSKKIPAFLLQPILENAIIHGIADKPGKGDIYISIFKNNSKIALIILDNGIGISSEEIKRIVQEKSCEKTNSFSSIGIPNVISRLELLYNNDYVFEIQSKINEYTKFIIEIPDTVLED